MLVASVSRARLVRFIALSGRPPDAQLLDHASPTRELHCPPAQVSSLRSTWRAPRPRFHVLDRAASLDLDRLADHGWLVREVSEEVIVGERNSADAQLVRVKRPYRPKHFDHFSLPWPPLAEVGG